MAIVPDPVGAYNTTFQTADSSRRDWERLEIAKQQQLKQDARQAVQDARQRKADDFNMMMKALSEDRDQRNTEADNVRADQQLRLGTFNADTSRYSATHPRGSRRSNDPLGLGGGSGSSGGGNESGFSFGGKQYGSDWGAAQATVFGGPNDPNDNGLSAFGGRTGPGGREGVAIPEKILRQQLGDDESLWANAEVEVTLGDGSNHTLNVADKGTAEWVWDKKGGPVLDLTEGAVAQLGGNVVYDRNGKMRDVQGIDIANVRVRPGGSNRPSDPRTEGDIPSPRPEDVESAQPAVVNASPPDYLAQTPVTAPDSPAVAPAPSGVMDYLNAPAQGLVVQPPPPVVVENIGEQDITQDTKNTLYGLEREALASKKKSTILDAKARRVAGYLTNPDLENPEKYAALAEQLDTQAIEEAGKAQEAAVKAKRIELEAPKIQQRQALLSAMSNLDDVLPQSDRSKLIGMSKDPASGGLADRTLNSMAAYSKVRDEYGLDYKSNGLKTADVVARAGANLATKEGEADRQAFETYTAATEALKDTNLDEGERKAWTSEKVKNTARAGSWMNRQNRFREAVKADTVKEPDKTMDLGKVEAPTDDAPKPAGLIDEANSLAGKRKEMSQTDQKAWSDSKASLRQTFGGREGLKQIIANAGGATSLTALKGILASALEQSSGGSDDFIGGRSSIPEGAAGPLPKNANSPLDVIDALAEDLWREDGRLPQSKATQASRTLTPKGMSVLEAYQKKQ